MSTGYYADYKKVYDNLRKDVPEIDKGVDRQDHSMGTLNIGKEHRQVAIKLKQDLDQYAGWLKMLPNLIVNSYLIYLILGSKLEKT